MPIDYDMLRRALRAGAVFAGTEELTVFKFNAAFRRDVYRTKDTTDQEAMLARIETGIDFRQREWAALTHSLLTGQSWPITASDDLDRHEPGVLHARNLAFKGITPPPRVSRLSGRCRLELTEDTPGFEWHLLETMAPFGAFRWSGPSPRSSIRLPVPADQAVAISARNLFAVTPATLTGLCVLLNGDSAAATLERQEDGSCTLRVRHDGHPKPEAGAGGVLLTLQVPRTISYAELGQGTDTRRLGIAVNWVEIEPDDRPTASAGA